MPRVVRHPKVILTLNISQTAAALGIHVGVVREAIDSGILTLRKCPGTRKNLITVEEISKWIASWPITPRRKFKKRNVPDAQE